MSLPKFLPGQDGLSRYLNWLRSEIEANKVCDSAQIKVSRTTRGCHLRFTEQAAPAAAEAGVIKQFRLKEVFGDYLRCREFDGTTEGGTDILVAKPYKLRRTPFDGAGHEVTFKRESNGQVQTIGYRYANDPNHPVGFCTRTATVTQNGQAEFQVIIPRFILGDVIFASQAENGTGVAVAEWQDINCDGRAWAVDYDSRPF